jgi:hypothetical protein
VVFLTAAGARVFVRVVSLNSDSGGIDAPHFERETAVYIVRLQRFVTAAAPQSCT